MAVLVGRLRNQIHSESSLDQIDRLILTLVNGHSSIVIIGAVQRDRPDEKEISVITPRTSNVVVIRVLRE